MVTASSTLLLLLLLACLGGAQTSSPRKFFAYSNANTRGPNVVAVHAFHYNDTLVRVGAWATGGAGDGLGQFGVDRVATAACVGYLYASNDATQSVSVFRVDRQTGALTLLPALTVVPVPPAQARFEDVAVALTPDGRHLIVGLGSSFVPNRLHSYRVNADGSLTLVSALTAPVIALPLRLSQLAVGPHSNLLAVSYTSVAGYVALYGLGADGALTELDLLPDMAAFGRAQGLAWAPNGRDLFAALVNNRPASVAGIGMTVSGNSTLGLQWMLQSRRSDDSNLVAVDPVALDRLFFSTQMPAVVVATPPTPPPEVSVTVTATSFVPSLLNVPFGTTLVFRAAVSGVQVAQGASPISCALKLNGWRSATLAAGQEYRVTMDLTGATFVVNPATCLSANARLLVVVDDKTVYNDTGATVNPLRARATSLAFTDDGEHLVTGLQVGGFAVQRVLSNFTVAEVAWTNETTNGLQGTTAMVQMPACCRNDVSGPVLSWEAVVNVLCRQPVTGPVVTLLAGCDWRPDQLVTEGVQIPTCNAECDALFRVTLTDVCGQRSVATQYVRHAPDVEPPVVAGGVTQARECQAGQPLTGDAAQLEVADQCQPREHLRITQALGPLRVAPSRQCRVDKVVASRDVAWSVADPCGNVATAAGTLHSIDTLAPVIHIHNWTVPCEARDQCVDADTGGVDPAWSGYATATDLCSGALSTTYRDLPTGPRVGCDPLVREWSAEDACGNRAVRNQTISFAAAEPPQFVTPPNVTVECSIDLGFDRTGYPTIQAQPCVDLVKRVDTLRHPSSERCTRVALRKFRASKTTCGAWEAHAEQYITQVDTQGPVLWVASPVHVTCEDGFDVWPSNPAVGYPRVLDACQGELTPDVLSYSDTIRHVVRRPPHCLDEITRVWVAHDGCGNRSNATQIIYATRECVPCGQGSKGKPCVPLPL